MRPQNPYLRREDESGFEEQLRPSSFRDFIGQANVVENLKIAIQAAKKRGEQIDHIIFLGLPGIGKTTLANIIAGEMNSRITVTSGPILKRPGDLIGLLAKLKDRDIIFIDEIHRMSPEVQEYLYSAMEDFFITINIDSGVHAKSVNLKLEKFTLIGATTREGLLTGPFRSRFGIVQRLDFYPVEDIKKIVKRSARILNVQIDDESAFITAQRSRGIPRIANRYLKRIRDLAQVRSNNMITRQIALEGLKMLGVDETGLEDMDRKILSVLTQNRDQPVGIKTISVAVGEQEDTIESVYEPYLIQQNFVLKTPRGRKATEKALKHMGITQGEGLFK